MSEQELPKKIIQQETEQIKDYAKVYKNLFEMLKTNKDISFTVFGIGNITDRPDGDTLGRRTYQFDKEKSCLVEDIRNSGVFDRDVVDSTGKKMPLFVKKPIKIITNDYVILDFMENVRGEENSRIFSDIREGNRFFAGFEGKRGEKFYTLTEIHTLDELVKIQQSDPEIFIKMIEALCEAYIPEYYNELKRLEKNLKKEQRDMSIENRE